MPNPPALLNDSQIALRLLLLPFFFVLLFTGQQMGRTQVVPRVLATFPEEMNALWPGDDGSVLAVTKTHLYRWKPGGEVTEVTALNDKLRLPETTIGWNPNRLALIEQSADVDWQTPWNLRILAPGPERTLPRFSGYKLDLCEQARVLLKYTVPMSFERIPPWSEQMQVYNLDGKQLPGWKEERRGEFHAACATLGGKPRIAVTAYAPEGTTCWLLNEQAQPLWKTELTKGWRVQEVALSDTAGMIVLSVSRMKTQENEVWLLGAKDGKVLSRITLQPDYFRGMTLSRNGCWAVLWTWPRITLLDIAGQRIRWQTQLHLQQDHWLAILSADVRDDGRVIAAHGSHTDNSTVTLYTFDGQGKPTALWKPTEKTNTVPMHLGQSCFFLPGGKEACLRFGKDLLAVTVPEEAPQPALTPAKPPTPAREISADEIPLLLFSLKSEDVNKRNQALAMLSQQPAPIREQIARALGKENDPHAVPALMALLSDTDAYTRFAAIDGLLAIHDPRTVPALLKLLPDTVDYQVHIRMIAALGNFADARAAEPLIDLLRNSKDRGSGEFSAVENALVHLGVLAVPALINALTDKRLNNGVPYPSILLGRIGEPAVDALLKLLKGDDLPARSRAIYALGGMRLPCALETLLLHANDRNDAIRSNVVSALTKYQDARATLVLIRALQKDPEPNTRRNAAYGLAGRKDPAARDVLLDALKDRDPQVFEAVAFALGSFKEPRAVAPLIEALSDEEPKNRMSAISALAQIGDKKAVASVMPLLDDKDKDVRRFAVSALEKLTGQHFGDDPAKWRAWWEEQQKVK